MESLEELGKVGGAWRGLKKLGEVGEAWRSLEMQEKLGEVGENINRALRIKRERNDVTMSRTSHWWKYYDLKGEPSLSIEPLKSDQKLFVGRKKEIIKFNAICESAPKTSIILTGNDGWKIPGNSDTHSG